VSKTAVSLKKVRGRWAGTAPAAFQSSIAFLDGGMGAKMRMAFSPLRTQ